MSYVQKTLSEKREYLVLQVGECRAQIAQLEERGAAIQAEISELQAAIIDIDSVLSDLHPISGFKYTPSDVFKDTVFADSHPVSVYYNGV